MLSVKPSSLTNVAHVDRLNEYFHRQKQLQQPIYYILPSNKYLQAARKRKAGIAFKTFDDLADLLLKQADYDYLPVSESERTLFFQQLMTNDQNRFSENPQELRHKAKAYAETYGQLKRIGLSIADLPSQYQQMESIFREYEIEWVELQRLLDPENRIHKAISLNGQADLPFPLCEIVIDGYIDFSTLQYMVIAYFVAHGYRITIYLPTSETADILTETKSQLKKLGFTIEEIEADQQKLETMSQPQVHVKSATTIAEEIYGVLEEIGEKSQETPFDLVGIVLADDKGYQEKLIKIAHQKQIPIQVPFKKSIRDSLFFQFIYQSLLKHNGRFKTRWDRLDLVDTFLRLNFLKSFQYMTKKQQYIETGFFPAEQQDELEAYISFRRTVSQKASIVTYLTLLRDVIEKSSFTTIWRQRILTETNTEKLQKIRLEWKSYDYFIALISGKIEMLTSQGIKDLQVDYHIFVDWLAEGLESGSIYLDRAPQKGIQLFSFREVSLFQGTHLYVLGMNEGVFPKTHKLAGFFQETDLNNLPVAYASPTKKLFRQKDDAFFGQLFIIANELSFSYVVGVDPHNPFLPSTYLEAWKDRIEERKYSITRRFSQNTSDSEVDFREKIAYHIGVGKSIKELPRSLEMISLKLKRLEHGVEIISPSWGEIIKRDKMSITMLESYAMCPFKYALERVLKVKEPLEKKSNLDFRDVGSMLHTTIEKFYKKLNLVGKPFSTFNQELNHEAETTLQEIFEAEWAEVEESHGDFSKLQLSIEKEEWQKKLRKWWFAEKHHFWENKQLQSMYLFRLEEPIELDLTIDDETTITLSGKIDRIDIDEHGFVIYDYKSGFASLNFDKEVRPGLKLQLPLYLVAIEKRLENGHYLIDLADLIEEVPEKIAAHGASYISLREPVKRAGNSVWREEHFRKNNPFHVNTTHATKEETLRAEVFLAKYELIKRIKKLWEGSTQDFSVKPLKCMSSCVYKSVCRVTQEQIEAGEEEWK